MRTAFRLAKDNRSESSDGRLFWIHRVFKGGVDGDYDGFKKKDYDDTQDEPEVKDKLESVITLMKSKFRSDEILELNEASFSDCVFHTIIWKDQIAVERRGAYDALEKSVQRIVSSRRVWMADSGGLGVPGAVGVEILHHCEWARQKVHDFVGRRDVVEQGVRRIFDSRGVQNVRVCICIGGAPGLYSCAYSLLG